MRSELLGTEPGQISEWVCKQSQDLETQSTIKVENFTLGCYSLTVFMVQWIDIKTK